MADGFYLAYLVVLIIEKEISKLYCEKSKAIY